MGLRGRMYRMAVRCAIRSPTCNNVGYALTDGLQDRLEHRRLLTRACMRLLLELTCVGLADGRDVGTYIVHPRHAKVLDISPPYE